MDLGRAIARHTIRRPHEVIDLEIDLDEPVVDAPTADDKQLSSETPEH